MKSLLTSTVGTIASGSTQAVGAVVSGPSKVISGVGLGVIQGVQSGVQGVTSGIEKVREAAIGPNDQKLREIEKQKEIENMQKKKVIVKTPSYLRNKHAVSKLDEKIFLSQQEIKEIKQRNPNMKQTDAKTEADQI